MSPGSLLVKWETVKLSFSRQRVVEAKIFHCISICTVKDTRAPSNAMVESLSPKFSVSLAAGSQSSSLKEMRACSHTREEMLLACVCIKAGSQQSWPVVSPVMEQ